jgi:hypothetical protein
MKKHLLALATGLLLGGAVPQYALAQQSEDKFLDFNPPLRPNSECLVQWVRYFDDDPCGAEAVERHALNAQRKRHPLLTRVESGYIDTCGLGVFAYLYDVYHGQPSPGSPCSDLRVTIRTKENSIGFPESVPEEFSVFEVWHLDSAVFFPIFVRNGFFCSDERWAVVSARPATGNDVIEVFPEDIDNPSLSVFKDFCIMLKQRYNSSFFVDKNRSIYFFIELPPGTSGAYFDRYVGGISGILPDNYALSFMINCSIARVTSVKEVEQDNIFSVHVRSATKDVFVKVEQVNSPAQIELLTLRGEVVYQAVATEFLNGRAIPVGHLPTGVYFVRYGNTVKKIMIGE